MVLPTFSQDEVVNEIRKEIFYNEFDLDKGLALYDKIVNSGFKTATITAYQAAAKALIAKYSWNPVSKFNSLKNVERLLADAVNRESDNLEIRFIRFYIENSIPYYLGYSKNMKEDCDILLSNIDQLSRLDLDKGISDYILSYLSSVKPECKKTLKAAILN